MGGFLESVAAGLAWIPDDRRSLVVLCDGPTPRRSWARHADACMTRERSSTVRTCALAFPSRARTM